MPVPAIMRNRRFDLYWSGVVLSEIGTRGTFAANLYHMYILTGSTLQTGLIGLAQAVALIVLSPFGGAWADRMDRRRLVQSMQALALLVSLGLGRTWCRRSRCSIRRARSRFSPDRRWPAS